MMERHRSIVAVRLAPTSLASASPRSPADAPAGRVAPAARRHGPAAPRSPCPAARPPASLRAECPQLHRESHHRFDVPVRVIPRQQHTHFATPICLGSGFGRHYAARPGACGKPPGALYTGSGKEWVLFFPLTVRCGRTTSSRSGGVRRYVGPGGSPTGLRMQPRSEEVLHPHQQGPLLCASGC